jgi:flagellar biosynthesis protein FliQ
MTMLAARTLCGFFIAITLALLSLLHLYWALGGRVGISAAVPELNGRKTLNPGSAITFTVAFGLAVASLLALLRANLVTLPIVPALIIHAGVWTLTAVFLLRAVGNFGTIGLFKSVRGTRFARLDSIYYSPLCLALGAGCMVLALS